jgi:hypothetical protein
MGRFGENCRGVLAISLPDIKGGAFGDLTDATVTGT